MFTGLVRAALIGLTLLLPVPALAASPYKTGDTDTVQSGHYVFVLSSDYGHNPQETTGSVPGIEARYGITRKIDAGVYTEIGFSGSPGETTHVGLSDTEVDVKYRFASNSFTTLAIDPTVSLPSGDVNAGLGCGHIRFSLPVWVQTQRKAWTFSGGGGWIQNVNYERGGFFGGLMAVHEISAGASAGVELYREPDASTGKSDMSLGIGIEHEISAFRALSFSLGQPLRAQTGLHMLVKYEMLQGFGK